MRTIALAFLIACGGAQPPATHPPALADLAWLQGTWHSPALDAHWQEVAGALYGVALSDQSFEVNIVDDSDGDGKPAPITLTSIEGGTKATHFALVRATPQVIEFSDPHDGAVTVTRTARGWRGQFTQPGVQPVAFDMEPGTLARSSDLEDLDRAFDDATMKSGADGWMSYFAPGGAMWRKGRVEGAAMHDEMEKTLKAGALRWTPVTSGVRGDTGFTLGTWVFGADTSHPVAHGSYCTIWKKQGDGSWKIVFDIGRPA